jgi:tRNA (guanine37-N1)-methyltransferase
MIRFDIVTIFPGVFDSYFSESIVGRAKIGNFIDINIHNLRDFTHDVRKTVDDTPYGGGAGMVMKIEPIFDCLKAIIPNGSKNPKTQIDVKRRIILFSAKGKRYTQEDAKRLLQYENIILICGRYEGVDERVAEHLADEEISIGDFVLTGGEIPAMAVVDSLARLIPGVLGNASSIEIESHSQAGILEYPQYTKPEKFSDWNVPDVLLSGNHKRIAEWREKMQKSNK